MTKNNEMKPMKKSSSGNIGQGHTDLRQNSPKTEYFVNGINRLDLKEVKELNNPVCILGMPGVADIGKMSLDHLINTLKAEKIIDIIFDDYPAGAIISESLLYAPKAEVYLWKDPAGKQDLLLVTADAQPMSPNGIYRLSAFMARLMADFQVKLILTLGGLPVDGKMMASKGTKIQATATDKELLGTYVNDNVQSISKGVVIGADGLVPTLAKRTYGIDGVVFLAETDGYQAMQKEAYDLKASMALITLVGQRFQLPIDMDFTDDSIQSMENKLNIEKESIKEELGLKKKESNFNLDLYC